MPSVEVPDFENDNSSFESDLLLELFEKECKLDSLNIRVKADKTLDIFSILLQIKVSALSKLSFLFQWMVFMLCAKLVTVNRTLCCHTMLPKLKLLQL